MRKGADAATIGGDKNWSTRASLRGSRLTDQYNDETDRKLHTPRSTKKGRLHTICQLFLQLVLAESEHPVNQPLQVLD